MLVLALPACARIGELRPIEPALTLRTDVDAGEATRPDAGSCTLPFEGPDCCSPQGTRVTSASCLDGSYHCSSGALCTCHGQVADFHCVDFCGTDAFVSPLCGGAGWLCPPGLIATTTCPAGTCFGEPGDCCLAPRCVDGEWTCADILDAGC